MNENVRGDKSPDFDFILYVLAVIARSDAVHIDRRYSTPADFAKDAFEFVDIDPDDIEFNSDRRKEFSEYRAALRGLPAQPAQPGAQPGAQSGQPAQGESIVDALNDLYSKDTPEPTATDLEKVKTGNALMFWIGIFTISAAIFQMKGWAWAALFMGFMVSFSSLLAIVEANRKGQRMVNDGGQHSGPDYWL